MDRDRDRAVLESLVTIKRAGAGIVLTYFAIEVAGLLRDAAFPAGAER